VFDQLSSEAEEGETRMIKSQKWLDRNIPYLVGKTILITGGTSGIGFQAALALLYKGARVIIACRDSEKAAKAKAEILQEIPAPDVTFLFYDQCQVESIRLLAKKTEGISLDAIVLNAGVYYPKKGAVAPDGTSMTFQTNAVGTYQLFEALHQKHKESRYVFVNSIVNATPRGEDYGNYLGKNLFSRGNQYAVSKRAVMNLFAYASSLDDCEATMTHPGVTSTEIIRNFAPWIKKAGNRFLYLFTHKSWKACLGIVYLASGKGKEGDYLVPRGPFHLSGYPKVARLPIRSCRKLYQNLLTLLRKKAPL
jgi:NAD(P)-dependent dehydrogenase (short-subunit alcohol dehydrogenase family)